MKKFISFLMVFMLCMAYCVPASAEDLTITSTGKYSLRGSIYSRAQFYFIPPTTGYYLFSSQIAGSGLVVFHGNESGGGSGKNQMQSIKDKDGVFCYAGYLKAGEKYLLKSWRNFGDVTEYDLSIRYECDVYSVAATKPGAYSVKPSTDAKSVLIFTPQESGTYLFSAGASNCNPHASLYQNNNLIASDSGTNDSFILSVDLDANVEYRLEVGISKCDRLMRIFNVDINKYGEAEQLAPGKYRVIVIRNGESNLYFTPEEDGGYTFSSTGANFPTEIYIYDESDNEIAFESCDFESKDFSFYIELDANKNYRAKITADVTDSIVHTFTVDVTKGGNSGGPASFANATTVGTYPMKATADDPAIILFTPQESGGYTFRSNDIKYNPSVEIYDKDENRFVHDANGNVTLYLKAGKTYRVEASISYKNYKNFNLDISYNGNASNLSVTEPGTYSVKGNVDAKANIYFTPQVSGTYTFQSDAQGCDPYAILNQGTKGIGVDDESGENGNFRITKELKAGVEYWLRIGIYGDENVMYSLNVSINPETSVVGSTISEGNVWIIAGIGVVAVVAIVVIVAKKKKKPALAEGEVPVAENTEKTEE